MSQEFDDVTHAFAELLSKLQSANDDDKHAAITFAIGSLLMAVGSIEHQLDALEQSNGIARGCLASLAEAVISGVKKVCRRGGPVDATILPAGAYEARRSVCGRF